MSKNVRSIELGQLISAARKRAKLSTNDVANAVRVNVSQISKLENGQVANPNPHLLKAVATTVRVPVADFYAAIGYDQPTELPTFEPYLRSKYGHLPAAAQAELRRSFTAITNKYGYSGHGPSEGEDET